MTKLMIISRYDRSDGMNIRHNIDAAWWKSPANHDGLLPAWHQTRHIVYNNGLSENSAVQNVTDGAVGASPHLLQLELLHSRLIWCDGCALDAHPIGLQPRHKRHANRFEVAL